MHTTVAFQEGNGPNFLNDVQTSIYVICNFWVDVLKTIEEEVETTRV
jgi:hypothetical protein